MTGGAGGWRFRLRRGGRRCGSFGGTVQGVGRGGVAEGAGGRVAAVCGGDVGTESGAAVDECSCSQVVPPTPM